MPGGEWRMRARRLDLLLPPVDPVVANPSIRIQEWAMPVRLHEVHPAIVHFPIAVLPLAIDADPVGQLTE